MDSELKLIRPSLIIQAVLVLLALAACGGGGSSEPGSSVFEGSALFWDSSDSSWDTSSWQ